MPGSGRRCCLLLLVLGCMVLCVPECGICIKESFLEVALGSDVLTWVEVLPVIPVSPHPSPCAPSCLPITVSRLALICSLTTCLCVSSWSPFL